MTRDEFKRWTRVEVRWGDMDAMGHVNNAKYFTFLESARIEMFRDLGLARPMTEERLGFGLVSASCNFRKQVHYPATLEIGTRVTKIGNTSFQLQHAYFLEGEATLMADAVSAVVWVDYNAGKGVPIPDEIRALLGRYT